MTTYRFEAELPQSLSEDDIERLRGLGEVRFVYVVEGESRREVARDLAYENMGWNDRLGSRHWWLESLSRGKKVGW